MKKVFKLKGPIIQLLKLKHGNYFAIKSKNGNGYCIKINNYSYIGMPGFLVEKRPELFKEIKHNQERQRILSKFGKN